MANDIALQPFQGPSGVGSYLSSYAQAQQVAQQRDAAERQKVIAGRQDEQYAREKQMQAIDALGGALDGIQDGDAQGFERVKGWAVQNGLIDANEAQRYTVDSLPQIRALSQQARAMIKERQAATLGQQKFALEQRIGEANIRQSDAAAAASRASAARMGAGGGPAVKPPSGYQYVIGEDGSPSLQAIPGGPADPSVKPLTDEQSKAAGYASRLRDADNRLWSPGVAQALMDGTDLTKTAIPLVGNSLVSNEYQIGDQAQRDFLNAQLRRESGAVINPSEFTSGSAQYFPQYGDKEDVLLNKAAARKQAIYNMFVAAGPRYTEQAAKAKSDYEKTIAAINKKRAGITAKPAQAHIDAADAIVGIKR